MFVSYLLTIDKGGEGFGDPLPLSQRAHIEGQVNPLARGQHGLEGGLGGCDGLHVVGQGELDPLLHVDVEPDGLRLVLHGEDGHPAVSPGGDTRSSLPSEIHFPWARARNQRRN